MYVADSSRQHVDATQRPPPGLSSSVGPNKISTPQMRDRKPSARGFNTVTAPHQHQQPTTTKLRQNTQHGTAARNRFFTTTTADGQQHHASNKMDDIDNNSIYIGNALVIHTSAFATPAARATRDTCTKSWCKQLMSFLLCS